MTSKTEYDVAFSFAGEDRAYVAEVADYTRRKGLKVFFDDFEKERLWGKDLYQHFAEIYQKKARFCVVFISQHYARKHWTKHELRNIQARQFSVDADYLLPARFDDTEIPGIPETLGYIDLARMTPGEFADTISAKLEDSKRERREHGSINVVSAIGDKDDGAKFLEQDLASALKKAASLGVSPSVVFFDIDDLTVINKVHGNTVGDSVLRAVFEIGLTTKVAKPKYFGRCGDDTFYAILFAQGKASEYCETLTSKLRAYKWNLLERRLHVSCTIGYADFASGMYVYQWLQKALRAMVEGKESGRSKTYCGNHLEVPCFAGDKRVFIASISNSPLSAVQKGELADLTAAYQDKVSRSTLKRLGEMSARQRYDFLVLMASQENAEREEKERQQGAQEGNIRAWGETRRFEFRIRDNCS